MMTNRAILAKALERWINQEGDCKKIKLVHMDERFSSPLKVDEWKVDEKTNIGQLAAAIEEVAKNDAQNGGREDGIREVFGIIPYFGTSHQEGALAKFSISAIASVEDGGSVVGSFTEGASGKGLIHQGQRFIEGLARTFIEGQNHFTHELVSAFKQLSQDNKELTQALKEMRTEVEDAKDRTLERNLAAYRVDQEETRKTKLLEGAMAAGPGLLAAFLGRPILPDNTTDQSVMMIKSMLSAITAEEMEKMQGVLSPDKYVFLMQMKKQVEDEKIREEERRRTEAEQRISGVAHNEKVVASIAKQDERGVPRREL